MDKLPNKCMITITPENSEILHKWANVRYTVTTNFLIVYGRYYGHSAPAMKYPEITFDDFEKLILKIKRRYELW